MKTGSKYAKIIPGISATVDVIFTHAMVPAGTFNLERCGAGLNNKILLNMKDNDAYQQGVHGIADSIEGTAAWLKTVIKDLGGSYVRMIGLSAGGTAAITFGHILDADAVIAVGPEIQLGMPGYRSFEWNPGKQYHPRFRNVGQLVGWMGKKLSIVFPAWDMTDFRHIHAARHAGDPRVIFVPDMHSGSHQIDWHRVMAAPQAVDLTQMTLNGLYDWQLDQEQTWQGMAGFEAIGQADQFAARVFSQLREIDPDNPGICYRAAMQQALLGNYAQAAPLWRIAAAGIGQTPLPLKSRFGEYSLLVRPDAYERLKDFVEAAGENPPLARRKINQMAGW